MRIDIVGLPASGKSTFAAALSKKLRIPYIELDRFWFESGGRQGRHDTPNLQEVRAKVREKTIEAARGEAWVSDGIYLHVQDILAERADVIIFLDIPLWVRLLGHTQRAFFEPKRHSELSLWDEITFYREIIRRDFTSRPKLLAFVRSHEAKALTLHSRKELDQYLKKIQ